LPATEHGLIATLAFALGFASPGPDGIVTSYSPVVVSALMPKASRLLSVPSPANRGAVIGPVSRPLVIARPDADPPRTGRSPLMSSFRSTSDSRSC